MNATDKNCASVQDLLLKKDFTDLTEHESLMLTEHLQQCEACRAFQQVLLNVQQAIQPAADEMLVPNPAIRQNLRNRIRRAKPARHASSGLREVWNVLRDILRLKIPVYQAVLGTAIIFAVFIGIDRLNARGEREVLQRLLSEQNGQQAIIPSEVPHRIAQIDSQKIGRSVAEDSLLMKFIVTAM
ncbi:hypothetical protein L0337_34905 [candidate division KSB1 bacterium]|nr:hypothetical protein [candidate division KSB1 bacterium]